MTNCTVSEFACFNSSGTLIFVPSTLASCDKSYPIVINHFDCTDPPVASISASIIASPSAAFASSLGDYMRSSMLFYGLLIFVAAYFVAIKFFKR